MKLIYCKECLDIILLSFNPARTCCCGLSRGHYLDDGLHAVITGPCIPLGFDNYSFIKALNTRPKEGMGQDFKAFIIPVSCPTVEHLKEKRK